MNKKGNIYRLLYSTILLVLIFGGVYFFATLGKAEFDKYTAYKEFCEERPTFCHCEWFECEYKTKSSYQSSYVNGKLTYESNQMSNDTLELCKLANKLNDKKMQFKAGCLE